MLKHVYVVIPKNLFEGDFGFWRDWKPILRTTDKFKAKAVAALLDMYCVQLCAREMGETDTLDEYD